MTQQELSILDKNLKGINGRLLWTVIVCTAVSVSTVLAVYYGFKNEIAIHKVEIRIINERLDRLEK